jgi:hypothetical protein
MHAEMVLVLLLSLVVCQFIILFWKNYHLRSYQVKNNSSIFLLLIDVFSFLQ